MTEHKQAGYPPHGHLWGLRLPRHHRRISFTSLAFQQFNIRASWLWTQYDWKSASPIRRQILASNKPFSLFCFIWPALMGSYLVFSAYLLLLCGLRVMCHPNLIISDPDFHLHVGGLLNPIPGKLFSILPVCVRSLLKCSSVLKSLPEAVSASDMNAERQMYLDKHTIVH